MSPHSTAEIVVYKDIPGFPGYRVGDDGSVWSCWRRWSLGRGCGGEWRQSDEWHQLKNSPNIRSGHVRVNLKQGTRLVTRYVHSLVLESFIGPRPPGLEGCHNDGDHANCRLDNLRYDMHAANMADMVRHGRSCVGERQGRAKFMAALVKELRARYATGDVSLAELTAEFSPRIPGGTTIRSVEAIIYRGSWDYVDRTDNEQGPDVRTASGRRIWKPYKSVE